MDRAPKNVRSIRTGPPRGKALWTERDKLGRRLAAGWVSAFSDEAIATLISQQIGTLPPGKILIEDVTLDGVQKRRVSRRKALHQALYRAELNYMVNKSSTAAPAESEMKARFSYIQRAASDFLSRCGLDPNEAPDTGKIEASRMPASLRAPLAITGSKYARKIGGLPGYPPGPGLNPFDPDSKNFHVDCAITDTINGVRRIAYWSSLLAVRKSANAKKKTKRGSPALNALIEQLLRIWVQICERRISANWSSSDSPRARHPTGPTRQMLDFVSHCLGLWGEKIEPRPLLSRIKSMRVADKIRPLNEGEFYRLLNWR